MMNENIDQTLPDVISFEKVGFDNKVILRDYMLNDAKSYNISKEDFNRLYHEIYNQGIIPWYNSLDKYTRDIILKEYSSLVWFKKGNDREKYAASIETFVRNMHNAYKDSEETTENIIIDESPINMKEDIDRQIRKQEYEMVNHPKHYNLYEKEVIDMMVDIWGLDNTATWCEMTAFKYRMRMGTKPENPIQQDLDKEKWYLDKARELRSKLNSTTHPGNTSVD